MSKKRENFESRLKRLEEITSRLEGGEMGLDESIEAYKEGIEIARKLMAELKEAEKKIQLIQKEAISEFESIEEFNSHIEKDSDIDDEE